MLASVFCGQLSSNFSIPMIGQLFLKIEMQSVSYFSSLMIIMIVIIILSLILLKPTNCSMFISIV